MYAALLSLRGWGVREFREFSPQLRATACWALYAEKVGPMLASERAMLNVNLSGLTPAAKLAAYAPKRRAEVNVPILEAVLYQDGRDARS